MKMYKDFINEANKFFCWQLAKRKSDGKIEQIQKVGRYTRADGIGTEIKYKIEFDEGKIKYYTAKELDHPTEEEKRIHFDMLKYNL